MAIHERDPHAEPTRAEVDGFRGAHVLEFGASWCGHCQAAQPLLAEALTRHPDVTHVKIEDAPGKRLGRSFRVTLWPTLVFLRDGKELSRLVRPTDPSVLRQAISQLTSSSIPRT